MKIFLWLLLVGLADPVFADLEEKEFRPPISAEQAAITARRVLAKHELNPKAFEIRSIQWKSQMIPGPAVENQEKGALTDAANTQLEAMQKQFGNGPAWEVRFWRTSRVADTGNWTDDIRYGLIVFVFDSNRAALMDIRTTTVPEDKLKTE